MARSTWGCRAGGNEGFEFVGADTGAAEELLIHGASVEIITLPTDQGGAAFIDTPGGAGEAAKLVGGIARRLFTQVFGKGLHCFQVLEHRCYSRW